MASSLEAEEWRPKAGPLMTRWARQVDPDQTLPEYPRPLMQRPRWLNLNGLWDYAIVARDVQRPESWQGQILVPFPVESALSGVMRMVGAEQTLWYRRQVQLPGEWTGDRVLLHFGASDWETTVYVNDQQLHRHRGGYDPFTIDISDAIRGRSEFQILVRVWDPIDAGSQPRGKQVARPEGIWYTPTTGIWQTVWLEPVPRTAIRQLEIRNVDTVSAQVKVISSDGQQHPVLLEAFDGDRRVVSQRVTSDRAATLAPPAPKLWSPDNPFLYRLRVTMLDDEKTIDQVESYFAIRQIALGKDPQGVTRILLNGQPLFQFGPLDQGFWPDGLYTAPTDEALRYDLEVTRNYGFNMCRKHVKVEPERWYHWCDRMGLLVWQDMPSGDKYIGPSDPDSQRSRESAEQFEDEYRRLIDARGSHPCIVIWVPFNEGWGQYDTGRIAEWTRKHDPSRLVNSASGWTDRGVGDMHDIHVYPGPGSPKPEPRRAAVLGEFGGLGLPLPNHTWQSEKNWGYQSFTTRDALNTAYRQLIFRLRPLIGSPGLSAAVYTQTTDVEIEVNGLMTYDREVLKLDVEPTREAHRKLFLPPPTIDTVIPSSQENGVVWKFTLSRPADDWMTSAFDDAAWKTGSGGFGTKGTPGAVVRSEWSSSDIWLRRVVELPTDFVNQDLALWIHHDEDTEVYVNGKLISQLRGYTVDYGLELLSAEAAAAFQPGRNLIAVHCRQTGGGQYIDVGLVRVTER
jgi:hypothetical protein